MTATSSSSSLPPPSIQEGNDIYMNCQMDANPRPLKPILWRFNGRPLSSASLNAAAATADFDADVIGIQSLDSSASIAATTNSGLAKSVLDQTKLVITNQSLVLRKVTRHQSGSYTCEASNQHGSSVSKPLELNIRHAPVCLTNNM